MNRQAEKKKAEEAKTARKFPKDAAKATAATISLDREAIRRLEEKVDALCQKIHRADDFFQQVSATLGEGWRLDVVKLADDEDGSQREAKHQADIERLSKELDKSKDDARIAALRRSDKETSSYRTGSKTSETKKLSIHSQSLTAAAQTEFRISFTPLESGDLDASNESWRRLMEYGLDGLEERSSDSSTSDDEAIYAPPLSIETLKPLYGSHALFHHVNN